MWNSFHTERDSRVPDVVHAARVQPCQACHLSLSSESSKVLIRLRNLRHLRIPIRIGGSTPRLVCLFHFVLARRDLL